MTKDDLLKNGQENNAAGSVNLAEETANNTANQESSTVQQTQNYLQQLLQNKPTDFNSKYLPQLETLYDKVMNRDKFSYDVQGDPLYQQYKNQYAQMGKLAMQDTIGNAAALTGGYGNSWAATAGNQAYQNYLQQLNDKVPALYESAYNRYAQEGEDLQNQLAITSSLYDNDYQKYMDDLNYMQQVQQLNTSQQAAAFEKLINMMQLGMTPSEELIAMAGITADDVAAYQKKLSGSGGGGAGNGLSDWMKQLAKKSFITSVSQTAGFMDDLAKAPDKTGAWGLLQKSIRKIGETGGAETGNKGELTEEEAEEVIAEFDRNLKK